MNPQTKTECCPPFDRQPWDEVEWSWSNKLFVKDHVISFFHIPMNYGAVMRRNAARMQAVGAIPETRLILTDETSLWGADVYIESTAEIPGAEMATLSGTFLSKVFEGPYRNIRYWMSEMRAFAHSRGKTIGKMYFFYTTCPQCAKKYGRNDVVIVARV